MNDLHEPVMQELQEEQLFEIAKTDRLNPYATLLPYFLKIGYSEVFYSNFNVQKGEYIVYAAPVSLCIEKEKIVRYEGGQTGASVRVMKGLTIHQGARRGRPIRENVKQYVDGDLVITNTRVVFIADKNGFEMKAQKIAACKLCTKNAFIIQSGNIVKQIVTDESLVVYLASFIQAFAKMAMSDTDTHEGYVDIPNGLSPEIRQKYEEIKARVNSLTIQDDRVKASFKPNGCFYALMVIAFMAFIGFIISPTNDNEAQQQSTEEQRSATKEPLLSYEEIATLKGHPIIGDSFENCVLFQQKIGDSRIHAINERQFGEMERNLKTYGDRKGIYFIQDSTHGKYVGRVEICITDEEADKMTLDKAISIVKEYLPAGFSQYYKKDRAYVYDIEGNEAHKRYVYSARLNDQGIDARNILKIPYSHYFSFYIVHAPNRKIWHIYTDHAAYGDRDLGWIQKYSMQWKINLNDSPSTQ